MQDPRPTYDELLEQLQQLSQWKKVQERKIGVITRYLVVGVLLIALGASLGFWKVQSLSADNKGTIAAVERLNHQEAQQAFDECVARNQQALEGRQSLRELATAHTEDHSPHTAAFWNKYLTQLSSQTLPKCNPPNHIK